MPSGKYVDIQYKRTVHVISRIFISNFNKEPVTCQFFFLIEMYNSTFYIADNSRFVLTDLILPAKTYCVHEQKTEV